SSLPVSISHINRSSSNLDDIELFKELIMHPNVILLNDCSNNPGKIVMVLNAARKRKNDLSVFTGNEFSCASYGGLGYKGFLLCSACFTGFIAGKILEFAHAGKIEEAQELQDYMNSLLIEIFGLDLEYYLIGQKQMMVELGLFSTAKTLQKHQISKEFIAKIKEIVEQEKEFLLPEIKPKSEE
ncbi:MAG: dihydrodipicolinate synthase family protein, partial [Victivallaceae bacterium]|nr:dihydrodipicolinate synthase family protein [Victivallaceae bacterium]